MATVERFEDLEIWQQARELVKLVYRLTKKEKFSKNFGLKDQIQRSSVSVMNNISEGFECRTTKRFVDYLGRSKGSCGETRSISYVALDCNYITKVEFKELYDLCTTISKKTQRFMSYLNSYDSNDRVRDVMVEYNGEL
jgi:four helix bundle protein